MPAIVKVGPPSNYSRVLAGRSNFAREIAQVSHQKATGILRAIGNDAVNEAEDHAARLYHPREDTNKRNRRRYPGSPHLHGSFRYEIVGNRNNWPVTITLTSDAPAVVVNVLNRGAHPHIIRPKMKKILMFPKAGIGESYSNQAGLPKRLQSPNRLEGLNRLSQHKRFKQSPFGHQQASGRSKFVIVRKPVKHPGVRASYFMELSVERAVDRVLRRQVRLKRD